MVNFSHSQYSLCSVFYKVKTFLICAICYEKSIYLVCRQNCERTYLSGASWDSIFIYSSLTLPVRALSSLWMTLAPFVVIADGKHGFLWTINMDFSLHKAEFIRGVLVTKKDQKSAYSVYSWKLSYTRYKSLWIVWVRSKKFICRITLISLFIKFKHSIVFLQLILHFRSVARKITQFLSPLASLVVNLGGRRAFICQGMGRVDQDLYR